MENAPAKDGRLDRLAPLLLLLVFIVLGAWARLVNAGSSASLWFDEAWRMQRLLDADSPLRQLFSPPNNIDPPLFNLVIYLLAQVHNTELVLRLASIIPGVLAILAAYLVGRQLFAGRWTALLAAFLIAFSPWATIFSKELKPYSLGLLVHLSVLYGVLWFQQRLTLRWTAVLAVTLLLSLFFSPNIVFAFPGICILMLWTAWEKKDRKLFRGTLVAGTVMLAGSILYYALLLQAPGGEDSFDPLKRYWQDHFCPAGSFTATVSWFFQRYLALYDKISFANHSMFDWAGDVLKSLYPLMALAGALIVLLRSRRQFFKLFCLFLLPVLVMVSFNLAGLWPFGPLRMNLFLLAYVLFPSLLLLDQCQRVRPWRNSFLPVGLAAALLMALQFPTDFDDFASRRVIQRDSAGVLTGLIESELEEQPAPLLVSWPGKPSFVYYTRYHETVSPLFREEGKKFKPIILRERDSRLYTNGMLLRTCQEHRQVATYCDHYNNIDQLLFRNDFSVTHQLFDGDKVRACILHSELTGYEDVKKPLFSSKWFSGRSEKWKNLYISPPLPLGNPPPGTLVVVNFDLKFNSDEKLIRFRFFDQDGSPKNLDHPFIENKISRIPRRLKLAAHTRLREPVEAFRLVLAARGTYDFVIDNVTWFITRPAEERPAVAQGTYRPRPGDRWNVFGKVDTLEQFWPDADQSYGWTMGDALIRFDDLAVSPEDTVLMLETHGWMPPGWRNEMNRNGLRVYLNGDRRARFLGPGSDPVRYYYFEIPSGIHTIRTLRIISNTFSPSKLGVGVDARDLGIDLKSVQFPIKAETAPAA